MTFHGRLTASQAEGCGFLVKGLLYRRTKSRKRVLLPTAWVIDDSNDHSRGLRKPRLRNLVLRTPKDLDANRGQPSAKEALQKGKPN